MSLVSVSMFVFAIFVKLLALSLFTYPLILGVESSIDSDKDALLAFRSQLSQDNPSGNPLLTWDHNASPCNWSRVVCDQDGQRVIGLNLSSLQLVGSISPYIGNLSFLQSLQLQNNEISNKIPNQVCNLVHLKVLNLSFNQLEGPMPSNLSRLRELKVMDLKMNKISGRIPGELSLLPKLEVLNLASNSLYGPIPASLGNVTSMTTLDLATNTLNGAIPSELSNLRNLNHLDLSINNLTGIVPAPLYNMSSLEFFALASNNLWGDLPYDVGKTLPKLKNLNFCINNFTGRIPGSLHDLTNIEEIRMAHNSLTGTIPPGLGNLPNLKMYNIGYNYIENSGSDKNGLDFLNLLANSTKLNFLAFDGNLLEGYIPESIGNLSKVLSKLYMGQNRIHGSIPSSISKLTGLTLLNISHNAITGPIPSLISQLQDLQVLDLSKNQISGVVPESLGNLMKLNTLDLSSNLLVDKVPSSFGGLTSLVYVDMSANMLNGTIPKEILSLSSLNNNLNLSHNQFDGQVPEEIGLLDVVKSIDLSNNRLSGNIPNSISSCKSLETLDLSSNFFSGPIPSSLDNLKALQNMDLSYNQLSSTIPSSLRLLNATQSLNLSFNNLEGELPCDGIFRNLSRVYLQGNPRLSMHLECDNDTQGTRKVSKFKITIIVVAAILVSFFMAACSIFFIMRRKRKGSNKTSDINIEEGHFMVKYDELRQATGGFNERNVIGSGSFGSVYKGYYLKENLDVAIKVLDMKLTASWKSFLAECEALKSVRHRNLVKLITSCSSWDHKNMEFLALVYEFLVNGSLQDWVKGKRKKENGDGLNFMERLNVAIDVASALDYLHHDTEVPVVHCDIKPSNILLDEDMTAKVGDFGLARLLMERMGDQRSISSSHVLKGSFGYMPPEYGLGAKPSTAGDTYSFGVTLLELFTGKSPSHENFTGEKGLVTWVQSCFPTQVKQLLLDPELLRQLLEHEVAHDNEEHHVRGYNNQSKASDGLSEDQQPLDNCLLKIFEVGLSCTGARPDSRITMREALHKLKSVRNKLPKS